MVAAYRRCDALVDLGPDMRARLDAYDTDAVRATVPPWALAEPSDAPRPPDPAVRAELFGAATLGLLYSGALGRAHDAGPLLELARACRRRFGGRVAFAFACRGHRAGELTHALRADDTNVRLAPLSGEADLPVHLEAGDVHLLGLRPAWAGLSVPSKFFGALAVGRPVVYAGSPTSDVARWIASLGVGFTLGTETQEAVLRGLGELAESPQALLALQQRARRAYDAHFRRDLALDAWARLLGSLVEARASASTLTSAPASP
jgi:colanic acid biosynthesis glycosyl transferase WcaI